MGFGYVFIGCLLFCNGTYHNYTDVFAIACMLLGLMTLAPYARGFRNALRIGIPTVAFAFVSFLLAICGLLNLFTPPTAVTSALAIAGILCRSLFLWMFFLGVEEVAKETDIPKLRAHALRSRFLTPIYATMGLLLESNLFTVQTVFLKWFLLGYLIFFVIYALLNAKTVYECYMLICYEGDENMDAPKPSRASKRKHREQKEDE